MGFFSAGELAKNTTIRVDPSQMEADCVSCGLYKNCQSPKMTVSGEGKKKILIIGEFPTSTEDEYGVQFVGESGEVLKEELRESNVSISRDCWKINAVNCRPETGVPTKKNIKYCNPMVEKTILTLKPKLIILLGSIAIESLLGDEFSDRSVNRWRAYRIPDSKYKCWIVPTFNPVQVIKNEFDYNLKSTFKRDIKRAVATLNLQYTEQKDYEQYVTILKDFQSVKRILERIIQQKQAIMFDYETTGLKPYHPGHKIVSIGIAISSTKAWAFPYAYKSFWTLSEFEDIRELWKTILLDKGIKKLAHNYKFEDAWSRVRADARPMGWLWDPMMSEHIIDNRSKSTGLKFQTYVNYGVRPYDKIISPYLKSKNGEFNTVEQAPFKELLIYNGLDCIFGWMRYEDQKAKLAGMKGLSRAYGFFMKGLHVMSTIQHNGINVDMTYYKRTKIELSKRIEELKEYLTAGREARKFKEIFGRTISLTSNQDLGKLFYEVLGKSPIYTDASNKNYKTDKDTLLTLNLPFVDKLQEMKRLEKAKGTYLGQFAREAVNGKMHPFFDLHIPVSYRSSSSMPNFQNLPKRDPEVGNLIRKGIVPSPNCVICECDFSGAEVITSVCVTGDTEIETIEGSKTILQIIKKIKKEKVYVYGYDLKEKRIKIAPVTDGGITGRKKEVWKVTLDNGKVIKATPNHKFMIRYGSKAEGKYVELRNLQPGMSLMPFYKKKKGNYIYVNLNNRKSIGEHTLIGIDVLKEDVGGSHCSRVVHHKKGFSNKLSNLEAMNREDHTSLHHKGKVTGPHSDEHKAKISKAIKGIPCPQRAVKQTDAQKKAMSLRMTVCEFTESHRQKLSDNKKEYWKSKENEVCKIFGKSFKKGTNTHLLNSHDMSIQEYKDEYNHKVVSVEFYGYEDVYNINVEGIHNYAVSAGVILKNCYHKDKNFYTYLVDPSTDMHRDIASDLWMLPSGMLNDSSYTDEQKKLAKMIRFFAKNDWTFAQFYGDWFGSCGPNLWDDVVNAGLKLPNGITVKQHLDNMGIYELGTMTKQGPSPGSFLEHCKEIEYKMWNERFPDYTQWKKDIVSFYQKYGYIETFFGFRFVGYMDKKQCTNFPIQGTSFHLLVYTLIEVQKFIRKNKLKTKLIGQIHDSVLADIPTDELGFYTTGINKIVTSLVDKFKWFIVPMEIEIEVSKSKEEGGNFAEMKEYSIEEVQNLYR